MTPQFHCFISNGVKPEHCQHQSVTHLRCLSQFGHGVRAFGFLDERHAGFDETFRQHQSIELGARVRHHGQVLSDFVKPAQFEALGSCIGRCDAESKRRLAEYMMSRCNNADGAASGLGTLPN